MPKRYLIPALALIAGLVSTAPASAAPASSRTTATASVSLTPSIGGIYFSPSQHIGSAPSVGFRLSYDSIGKTVVDSLGVDASLMYFNAGETPGVLLRLDVIYPFVAKTWTPFIAIGGGTMNVSGTARSGTYPVFNYGGGVKYQMADYLALRGDLRHLFTYDNANTRNGFEATFGVSYYFGKERKPGPVKPPKCKDIPKNVPVDADGCPFDADRDGVPDYLDKCPDTPQGIAVDKDGCPDLSSYYKDAAKEPKPKVKKKITTIIGLEGTVSVTSPDPDLKLLGEEVVLTPGNKVTVKAGETPPKPVAAGTAEVEAARDAAQLPLPAPEPPAPAPPPPPRPPLPKPEPKKPTRIIGIEGSVTVVPTTTGDRKPEAILTPGKGMTLRPGEPPTAPAEVSGIRLQQAKEIAATVVIEFPTGSATVNPKYHEELKRIITGLKAAPTSVAVIEGHTDFIGKEASNLELSKRRAESVRRLLKKFGADPKRLTAMGYGATQPIADNLTSEGRQKNRRAVAIVTIIAPKE